MIEVRLLLDENLSEATLGRLEIDYPGSLHVRASIGGGASDESVWNFAKTGGLVLVTRDEDFERLSVLNGAPPKVIWLAGHNLTNTEVVDLLHDAKERIERFVADESLALLVIERGTERPAV